MPSVRWKHRRIPSLRASHNLLRFQPDLESDPRVVATPHPLATTARAPLPVSRPFGFWHLRSSQTPTAQRGISPPLLQLRSTTHVSSRVNFSLLPCVNHSETTQCRRA